MKYNGIELKEITTPQIFDPPKEMLVWNDANEEVNKSVVGAIAKFGNRCVVITLNYSWDHCAEIPEKPKSRRATKRELSKWLAQGKGEFNSYGFSGTAFNYRETDADKQVEHSLVRKWTDTEWYEPTIEYLGIDDKYPLDSNVTPEVLVYDELKYAERDIWNSTISDKNCFKDREVKIGNQVWMNFDLDVTDGGEGVFFNRVNCKYYYTWEAAKRIADKIPGWHLPSKEEFEKLIKTVGGKEVAGKTLMSTIRSKSWCNGTDDFVFSALPADFRSKDGHYYNECTYAELWSSTEYYGDHVLFMNLSTCTDIADLRAGGRKYGRSVRLIKD